MSRCDFSTFYNAVNARYFLLLRNSYGNLTTKLQRFVFDWRGYFYPNIRDRERARKNKHVQQKINKPKQMILRMYGNRKQAARLVS